MNTRTLSTLAALGFASIATPALAVVNVGPGGSGVRVGNSSLIGNLDYSDTLTGTADGGLPGRAYVAVGQPAVVESNYSNPARLWEPNAGNFSYVQGSTNTGFVPGANPYAGGNTNAGTETGYSQSGGPGTGAGFDYGIRNHFIFQADVVVTSDRVDLTLGADGDANIFDPGALSIFFRDPDATGFPDIGIYTPSVGEANTGFTSSVLEVGQFANMAIRANLATSELEVFVNEVSLGTLQLSTFAGGAYAPFLNNRSVGISAAGGDRLWFDNAQVGAVAAALPEPASATLLALTALAMLRRRSRVA